MSYNYLEEDHLSDALHDSEEYMRSFYDDIPELQRITRGKPGKVPEGKPRVTDGTLAGIRREMPKNIIQQLPTGQAVIRSMPEAQDKVSAILTDIILPNANSGGTPFAKAKRAVKATVDVGSAWAVSFYNRRGDLFYADFRLKHYRDVLFEQGKTCEFDNNYMPVIDWWTKSDLKALIWTLEQQPDTDGGWNVRNLKELLDKGPSEKQEENKTEAEKKNNSNTAYFKIVTFYQIGVNATWYIYAPATKKCLKKWQTKDPRGVIPVRGLVPEDDDENPLGEPLAAISAPKQNLIDYDMQMYQYTRGIGVSPPVKKWGTTPNSRIKLVPDRIISMVGDKNTDDFEVVNMSNAAIENYPENYGLLKSQILNEMGRRNGDSTISAASGNPGFSKTAAGVKEGAAVTSISNNDLTKSTELWLGRIFEDLLNIHISESQGIKQLELEDDTMKRYNIEETPEFDYDQDYGKIRFTVDASSSQAQDNDKESEKLGGLLEIKAKYGTNPDSKFMLMFNQLVKNAGVDNPTKLFYTDDEIAFAQSMEQAGRQMMLMKQKQAMQAMANPPVATDPNQATTTPQPEVAPATDPVAEDREAARQLLLGRGASEEEADRLLAKVDAGAV